MDRLASSLAEFFLANLQEDLFAVSRSKKNVLYNGTRLHTSSVIRQLLSLLPEALKFYIKFPTFAGKMKPGSEELNLAVSAELLRLVVQLEKDNASKTTSRRLEEATKKALGMHFSSSMTIKLSDLRLIVNIKDREKSFLYDPIKDIAYHTLDYRFVVERLRTLLDEGYSDWMATNSEDCHLVYLPHNKRFLTDTSSGEEFNLFNTWSAAGWMNGWEKDEGAELAPELEVFFKAFLPDDQSRLYTLAWLRDVTFGRAEPILVLCGTPGTGKNIFVEKIGGALVGAKNLRMASKGFGSSQFHNNVSHCSLFFLDEQSLDNESRETLKAYHNGTAAIERKGKDVGDPEKISASFVIANNYKRKIKLEYNDRKFFVPDICEGALLVDIVGQPLIDLLVKNLNDPAYVQEFASYLYYNFTAGASAKFPKTKLFKEICINSFPLTFRRFIHTCQKKEEITSTEFNRRSKFGIDPVDLEDMIKQYEVAYKEKLCEFTYEPSGLWVAKSCVYTGPKGESKPAYSNGHDPEEKVPTEAQAISQSII